MAEVTSGFGTTSDFWGLIIACKSGNLLSLQRLLREKRPTLQNLRAHDNLALRTACEYGHLALLKHLMTLGFTVNDVRSTYNYALRKACRNGHLHIIEYLLEGMACVDPITHEAAQSLTLDDVRVRNNKYPWSGPWQSNAFQTGKNAFDWACRMGHLPIVNYLINRGLTVADIRDYYDNALLCATNKNPAVVQALIWAGHYTAEEVAAIIGDSELCAQFIYELPEPAFEDLVKGGSAAAPITRRMQSTFFQGENTWELDVTSAVRCDTLELEE